jgi:hypothetical protein
VIGGNVFVATANAGSRRKNYADVSSVIRLILLPIWIAR